MAEHYGDHPSVIGWQIDNEFGERCYCPTCAEKFHIWLRSRYESIDDLNQKWGTIFWSHCYNDWTEIPIPLKTGRSPNPGLALDYYRFCTDSYISFQQLQIAILRNYSQNKVITHNLMGFNYDKLNYFDFARDLDVVGFDSYPRSQWSFSDKVDPSLLALNYSTMRGLKQKNFWMLEQQAGSGGWEMISVTPRPGELRLWAYQAIAHGADAVLFFRWRTARFGIEQYWHGLLDHDAYPSRRYKEIKQMGREIKQIGEQIVESRVKSRIAMLLSYDSRFAFQIQPNHPGFSYEDHFHQVYSSFYRRNISVDITAPNADLSAYDLIVAPSLHLLNQADADNLMRYVSGGGILLVTQRTGVKDEFNAVVNQRLPGLLAKVCGVEVEEYDSLHTNMHNSIKLNLPELDCTEEFTVGVLCDILRPTTSSVVAHYTQVITADLR
jgi:beta-galactosidase